MDGGFYPHTVRFDAKDRVVHPGPEQPGRHVRPCSAQIHLYDPPFRSLMERITVKLHAIHLQAARMGHSRGQLRQGRDHVSTGVPLPYGIDITPDGKAWIARLHTDEIASVDPDTGTVTMVKTPFQAPRRLRSDKDGNLWIAAFNESQIVSLHARHRCVHAPGPARRPQGSDTPYSLNVDRARHQVWVNGTNSDAVYRYDIATQAWSMFPMQRHVTFTRDVEFRPRTGLCDQLPSFPSWHIEDAQPTLIEITPQ